MAKSIPVDVMRDMRNNITDMRAKINRINEEIGLSTREVETLRRESSRLESMADGWQVSFPETESD